MSNSTSKIKVYNNFHPYQPVKSRGNRNYVAGIRKDLYNYAIADVNTEYKSKLDTNNYLPPPPRTQNVIDPVFSLIRNTPYSSTPYKYGMTIQDGIKGIVQYQVDNSNFARGNDFALGEAVKRLNYTAEVPVVDQSTKKTIASNSPFYPYPNFGLTFDKNYRTYAHPKRYNSEGKPIIESFCDTCIKSKTSKKVQLIIVIAVVLFIIKLFI